jgi:hypothetical protein
MIPILLLTLAVGGPDAKPTPEGRAVAFLSREVPRWAKENGCYSCHNNADGARALYVAVGKGRAVKPSALADTTRWLANPRGWAHNKGDPAFKDKKLAELQFASALAEASRAGRVEGREPLREAARMTAGHQKGDGSWLVDTGGNVGGATTHGTALATALAVRTLREAGRREDAKALRRAGQWFRKAEVKTVLDAAAVLWGLGEAKDAAARARRERCLEVIRKGEAKKGGWGPYVTSAPEAFDTAVVLLALRAAPATEKTRAMLRRGREYLVRTQEKDGGWPETTRPAGNTSYSQRISTSSWATWALLETR